MKRALVLLAPALVACSDPSSFTTTCSSAAAALSRPLLVLERGDQTAALARVSGGCLTESSPDPVLGMDQYLLDAHGAPFVGVNDDGALRAIDPDTLRVTRTVAVYPDHPGAAVHGIYGVDVDASGNLWVSRDDVNEVAVFAPDGTLVTTVDLSTLDADEHHPDMNGILVTGGFAYVALGFLTHGMDGTIVSDTARRPGMIAVIDTAAMKLVDHFDLVGHNPVRKLVPIDATGTKVIVATPGQHDVAAPGDGIDLVDLVARTATQLVSETRLGGSVDEVVWAGPHEVYAITLGPQPMVNPTKVVVFDPDAKDPPRELARAPYFDDPNGAAYVHVGLAVDCDVVVAGDRTRGAAAVRVFPRAQGPELAPVRPSVEAPWGLLPYGSPDAPAHGPPCAP